MVICSAGPPLTALVALVFGLLLASASQSHPTAGKPPPPPPPSPPPRSPPPPPSPRPRSPYSHRGDPILPPTLNHSPPPPWRKPIQGPLLVPPPPSLTAKPKGKTHNLGKKVGISFAGIAVIMQFAVAGFLAYKKKQIYRVRN